MARLGSEPDSGPHAQAPAGRGPARHLRFSRLGVIVCGTLLVLGILAWARMNQLRSAIEASYDPSPLPVPYHDAPFVTTPQEVVDKMLEVAGLTNDDVLYDLGCGDGRIVVTAAKRFGCRAVGYDNNPDRVRESLENVEKNEVGDLVTIDERDIFTLDLSEADVITLYLLPRLNVKLIPQLEKLEPGSRILSHDFDIEGVRPDKVVTLTCKEDGRQHAIYLWTTPLCKTRE
jgi:SAM-dependent methyltransferase